MFKNAKIIGEVKNPDDYHKQKLKRGDPKFQMSISALKEFDDCASRWKDGYESPESTSREYGSLLDCLVLTPENFPKLYAVRPEKYINEKGKEMDWHHASHTCQKWIAEAKKKGLQDISKKLFDKASAAASIILKDKIVGPMIAASQKQVWIAANWYDEATKMTIPVKCMIDLLPLADSPFYKNVADLKSCTDASPKSWSRTVFNWRYHWQGAFNLDIVRAALPNEDRCNFCHIAQESYEPFQVGRRVLGSNFLELGTASYRRALANYCWCLKNEHWPDYDDNDEGSQGWSITNAEPWMEGAMLFAPRFRTPAETDDGYILVPPGEGVPDSELYENKHDLTP